MVLVGFVVGYVMCSVYLMMDKTTRKVSKLIEEARKEINPFALHCDPLIHNNNNGKLLKLDIDKADQVRTGLIVSISVLDRFPDCN